MKTTQRKAEKLLDHIDDINNQVNKRGDHFIIDGKEYYYGGEYHNNEGFLPKGCTYQEYDINPLHMNPNQPGQLIRWRSIDGNNFWKERLIVGSDGSAYITMDHYGSGLGVGMKKIR